jgi:hypothetical protein
MVLPGAWVWMSIFPAIPPPGKALSPLLAGQRPGVTVLRDYHAENIMLLERPSAEAGPARFPGRADRPSGL